MRTSVVTLRCDLCGATAFEPPKTTLPKGWGNIGLTRHNGEHFEWLTGSEYNTQEICSDCVNALNGVITARRGIRVDRTRDR